MDELFRIIPAGVLAFVGLWIAGCNVSCVYLGLFRGKHHSLIPLLGGGFLSVAWLVYPVIGGRTWAWIPLGVDLAFWIVMAGIAYVRYGRREQSAGSKGMWFKANVQYIMD